ncbi:unnamed protein product [Dovyalis caffra]|uniref:G patch domain-containing protein n=1 Tax=Dovyalis caffra TaxID=77055 RepID=A0AAV1QQA1_9ROSI|nr:unnamed protein product [Dovyalis caffra]
MDIDEDDFVFFGTPIEREEELTSRKKKPSRKPPVTSVRDEEGRRRFHGAFTGGFSAGYYNTAGSKEGWAPQSFTSSRKNRAEFKQQSILNFLDEDEKEELEGRSLGTSSQFDTFGFTAAEIARKKAENEQQQRPSAIPGPAPDEIVLPATESIGVKLLLKMGWRHGHSIKDSRANSLYKARREARKAFLAFSSDDAKSQLEAEPGEENLKSSLDQPINDDVPSSQSTPVYILNPKEDTHGLGYDPYKHAPEFRGRAAPGFGIGALEEYDAEDEDVYASAYDFEDTHVQEDEEPLKSNTENRPKLLWKEKGVLPGFKAASDSDYQLERKLWEEQQKHNGQKKIALDGKSSSSVQKMTAESRGKILGEMPLERSSRDLSSSVASGDVNLPFNLSDTFTKPTSFSELLEVAKPFNDDPAKQERFEQFLREKYQGGIRSTVSGGASNMSEAARAYERLDFEAAADAIEKGKFSKENKLFSQQLMEFSAGRGMQFTSGGLQQGKDTQDEDLATKKIYPIREEFQWRPSSILCKRFDLVDPYMGKPPPSPRMRSKMDSLIVTSDLKAMKMEEAFSADRNQPLVQSSAQEVSKDVVDSEIEVKVHVENVERPVDLYKAIFSDDSDDEVEASSNFNAKEDPEKQIEVAHSTLNRLMAGDFLESLGKELGLEVPPDPPYSTNIARSSVPQKESAIANTGNVNILPVEENSFSTPDGCSVSQKEGLPHDEKTAKRGESKKHEQPGSYEDKSDKLYSSKIGQEDREAKSPPSCHRKRGSSSSSEDERSRKRSRGHRYRSSDLYSDSSSDHLDRYHSRSKGRKKRYSREKRSSKKHSKHHKHGSRDSSSRSYYEVVLSNLLVSMTSVEAEVIEPLEDAFGGGSY